MRLSWSWAAQVRLCTAHFQQNAELSQLAGLAGVQGSSVVEHLLSDAHAWRIRVPTRSPDSDAASKLKARGVEVVQADLLSPEDVKAVMAGAWAVFGVTLPTL